MAIHFSPYGNSPLFLPTMQPAVGYLLFVYQAGSTTKVPVYSNVAGSAQHTNPIVLDANGYPPLPLYLNADHDYRFVYAHPLDLDPPISPILNPVDHVSVATPPTQALASEWVVWPNETYINGTQFSVTGTQPSFAVGRRVRATISADDLYGVITAVNTSGPTVVTVRWDSGALDNSLSEVAISFLNSSGVAFPGIKTTGLVTEILGNLVVQPTASFNLIPPGTIIAYAGQNYPPDGYLLTDGASYLYDQYPKLFGQIGSIFGAGSGFGQSFNVPTVANLQTNIRYIIRHS